MSIYLNQTKVPGTNVKVSAQLHLAGEDMSGQGSYTPQAETGDKAKEVNVSLQIRMADVGDLRRLMAMAEAKSSASERLVYRIINETANAMGIREVRFQGSVQVREDEGLRLWLVSFSLIEYRSAAEKKEARAANLPIGTQAPTGTPVTGLPASTGLSEFEKIMAAARELLK